MSNGEACLALIFIGLLRWVLVAWALMLLVGVVHREFYVELPAVGFGPSLLVSLPLLALASLLSPRSSKES